MEKDKLNEAVREIEIMEFRAGGNSYGIDVNDIREILPYDKNPLPVPNAHPFIEGIIKPRDFLIPVVNLLKCLRLKDSEEHKNDMLIVTAIQDLNIGFHVDSVRGIYRVKSSDVRQPGEDLTTSFTAAVSGILPYEGYTIEVLNFRLMLQEVNPKLSIGAQPEA